MPQEDRQNLGELPDTLEIQAFEEFCSQLKVLLDGYLASPSVTDHSHRVRRVLEIMAMLADDMRQALQQQVLLN